MAIRRLNFSPGVDIESTQTASRGGWNFSNLIRWRVAGGTAFLEKLRGWARISQTALTGVCRALHFWSDLDRRLWLAAGTNSNLYVERDGDVFDITPFGFAPGLVSSSAGPFSLMIWSLDNFGEIGMFCASGRPLYSWQPPPPPNPPTPALEILTGPPQNQLVLVTMPQRIVMAMGSSPDAGVLDPMLIRWSAQSDFTDWTPTTINQAGSFRLSRGTRIMGGLQAGLVTYIWTDEGYWTAQYIQFPLVFGFFQQGSACGLIAQNAVLSLGISTYWMASHGFFVATGTGFAQLECPVWDYVFLDIDELNQDKCLAASDYRFNEVSFFFPSASGGTGEIDSYAKFNVQAKLWDVGRLVRTAWTDDTPNNPVAVDQNGILQAHNIGYDDDGNPMFGVSATSGYIDLSDGEDMLLLTQLIPDAQWEGNTPSFDITILVRSYPGDAPVSCGPFHVTPQTNYFTLGSLLPTPVLGIRGREVAIQITSDAPQSWFRMGVFRVNSGADGKL